MARATPFPARLSRRALLGGAASVLAACGYTPVYGPGGSGSALDRAVELDTPQTANGFTLRQRLQDRLGPPDRPRYRLAVTVETSTKRVAVTRNQDTRRYNLIGRAHYVLTTLDDAPVATGSYGSFDSYAAPRNPVTEGTFDSFNSYSATGTTVATLAAERDAYRRLMIILADGIMDRLYLAVPGTQP